jgi:hypothetical protein
MRWIRMESEGGRLSQSAELIKGLDFLIFGGGDDWVRVHISTYLAVPLDLEAYPQIR